MMRRLREDLLNGAFGELAGVLILLFDNPDAKSGSYVGSTLSFHARNYFLGVIFITARFMESAA
jgi:hypothetical protein